MKRNLCRVVVITAFLLGSIPATLTRGPLIGPSEYLWNPDSST
jgi:hypothetical protein